MHWIVLSLSSAVILGVYGLAKKAAVHENAVPPVLFLNVLVAALVYAPLVIMTRFAPQWTSDWPVVVGSLTSRQHGLVFCKSSLVGASWTLAFYALKHLPISIATPIRSTSPLWTIVIAVTFLSESPRGIQWAGMAIIMCAFFAFSRVGRREGIDFRSNRWVLMMIAATLLGSVSALYDKFLLQRLGFEPVTLQAWFSVYLAVVLAPFTLHWFIRQRHTRPFQFRWSIPLIAVTLLTADLLYFKAIRDPDALISVISPIRRTSVIIPFLYGVVFLGEKNARRKGLCIGLMLVGVYVVSQ